MQLHEIITDPFTLAGIIMLFYPKAFDLFEIAIQWFGVGAWIDGKLRKTILAAILAYPFAFFALWLGASLFPENHTFEFNAASVLGEAIVGFILANLTLPIYKGAGLTLADGSGDYRRSRRWTTVLRG
jgi:hypothetical protein